MIDRDAKKGIIIEKNSAPREREREARVVTIGNNISIAIEAMHARIARGDAGRRALGKKGVAGCLERVKNITPTPLFLAARSFVAGE